ncbi:putative phospholipid import ATP-binding protein MlaF [Pandoraea terrigena]|uniref:Putative phospholipid import ATP-binding protein MlaF n=1 Tax=Pandoraea terrigena TaxID=2508292 RepID=A0A5E4W6A8_9BURK|nr:putative phospholipid import ATP-binding protein MlaF [Pandoraea terrigena]
MGAGPVECRWAMPIPDFVHLRWAASIGIPPYNWRFAPHYKTRNVPTPNPENLLELRDVSFGYGERLVLSGLNMRFPRGKVIGVMGGSGCGKTTVLRLIGGLVHASRGTVDFDGTDVASLDHAGWYRLRRRMGMLFQFGALFTDMTVFDNVAFPLREHTRLSDTLIRDLVLMKLNAVGLRGARDMKPAEISGGMARRVALARTIALDPDLVMYDEPFTGLDPISLGITANLIRKLNDALGATSIIVSHDVTETFAIADYIYFISEGRIGAEGTPEAMRASSDPTVRQFIDAQPDGPVKFQYPAPPLADDFGMGARA